MHLSCDQTEDFLQNLFTPPPDNDRPEIWLSCEKTVQKYTQLLTVFDVEGMCEK